jgi:hypothetical protein
MMRKLILILVGVMPVMLTVAIIGISLRSLMAYEIDNTFYRFLFIGIAFLIGFPLSLLFCRMWGKVLLKLRLISDKEAKLLPYRWPDRNF